MFIVTQKNFNKTRLWAGDLRRREVNVGNTPLHQTAMQLRNVRNNLMALIEFETHSTEEIAVRFY